jgi:hypothetical protein
MSVRPFNAATAVTACAVAFVAALAACAQDTVPATATTTTPDSGGGGDGGAMACMPGASDDASPPPGFDASAFAEAGTPASADCDLGGRWLVAQRVLADALGQTQASRNWFYYELHQDGEAVTVTKGLHCGYEVKHVSALGADVDTQGIWPAILAHDNDAGRQGTVHTTGTGCQVDFEKRYTVRGATLPYYADPSRPMPTVAQQAGCGMPGWEDWDGDGKPGVTLTVQAPSAGHLYCAQRDWTQFSGAIAKSAAAFKLGVTWDSGQDVLGYDGSSIITQSSVPDADASQHFVVFARLQPDQATGDDAAICAAVRALVPTLAPDATQ